MLIFLDKGTGGVEGCEAFMLNFELCLIIRDLFEELPILLSSLLISDKLALGASGELTGLFFLLLLVVVMLFVDVAGFKNFIKSLDLDFLSVLMLLLGICCCPPDCCIVGGDDTELSASGDAMPVLVLELPLKMPDIVCINVFFW